MPSDSEFETLLEMFGSVESKLRLEELKRRLSLHEEDAIWIYIAALEHYQRLFETVPLLIKEAAEAERERLREELRLINVAATANMNNAAQLAVDAVNRASGAAVSVADSAVDKAAGDLVNMVARKINATISVQASAALWRERATAITFALVMGACSTTAAWLLSPNAPDSMIAAVKNEPMRALIAGAWHAPMGWVITITAGSAALAFAAEIGGTRFKAWAKNKLNNNGY